jgi:NADH dehydrogenase
MSIRTSSSAREKAGLILALASGPVAPHRIVIVGGGFGGLHLVRGLERELRPGEAEVTLVDRNNYHLFTPLLYQVATGELPPHAVAYPLRQTVVREAKYRFIETNVESIDLEAHTVATADGPLPFDRLVVAAGSVTNDFGIPGVRQHALGMKYLDEAQEVRRHVLGCFERADLAADEGERRELLTFAIIGAGPVGVELSSSLRDLFDHSLRGSYANVDVDRDPRIVLLDAGDRVLATMDERLARIAAARLARQHIDVRLGRLVSEVGPGIIRTRQGEELRASTIVWAGGVRTAPLVTSVALPQSRGRLIVDAFFRVSGRDDLFALGDGAYVESQGRPLAQLAQVAVLEAPSLAANLVRLMRGQPPRPYVHKEKGDLVALGRTSAGARLRRFAFLTAPRDVVFGGFPAWTVWRVNYLMELLGVRNRTSLLTEWILSYFTTRMVANIP